MMTLSSLRVRPVGAADDNLYVFKTPGYSTDTQWCASVLPSGLESQFPDVNFDWKVEKEGGNKVNLVFDEPGDKRRKFCRIVPKGYHKNQVSESEGDVLVSISWKIPGGFPKPYHTASCRQRFTVRTPVRIHMYDHETITWGDQAGPKHWRLHYEILDNLGKRLPAERINGLEVNEMWNPHILTGKPEMRKYTFNGSSNVFWDDIAGKMVGLQTYSGRQRLTFDQIDGWHEVTIDAQVYDGNISSEDITANGF